MPLTPDDTQDSDIIATVEQAIADQPLVSALIALLVGFIVGSRL